MQHKSLSHNEAAGIAHRVASSLAGGEVGFDATHLAWQFASSTERANHLLATCADKLGKGEMIDSYVEFNSNRHLVETIEALEIKDFAPWTARCRRFSWKEPAELKTDMARLLKDAFTEVENFKSVLLEDYRSRLMRKKPIVAYPVIKFLAANFEKDASLQQEFKRITASLISEMEADLMVAFGSASGDAERLAILKKYRSQGLDIPSRPGVLQDALAQEEQQMLDQTAKIANALLANAASLLDTENWIQVEQSFLSLEPELASEKATARLGKDVAAQIEQLRHNLAAKRGAHDSNILLKDAVDAIGSRSATRQEIDSLKNIISHAKLLGYSCDPALVSRVEALESASNPAAPAANAKPKATKPAPAKKEKAPKAPKPARERPAKSGNKIPLYATAGVAAAIVIGVGVIFMGGGDDKPAAAPAKPAVAQTPAPAPAPKAADVKAAAPVAEPSLVVEATPSREHPELETLLSSIAAQLEASPGADAFAAIDADLENARQLADHIPVNSEIVKSLRATEREVESAKSGLRQSLLATAETAKQSAEQSIADALAQSGVDSDSRLEKASADLQAAQSAHDLAAQFGAEVDQGTLRRLETQLSSALQLRDAIANIHQEIAAAKSLDSHLAPLQKLLSLKGASENEKFHASQVLAQRAQITRQLEASTSSNAKGYDFPSIDPDFSPAGKVTLSPAEASALNALIDSRTFTDVFASTVRYYQGSSVPVSERTVYLANAVEAAEQRSGRRLSITFDTRGFDEEGRPRNRPHQASYLQNTDGSLWGYFYTPSTLSKESEYYTSHINPKLKQILASPRPLGPLALIEEIAAKSDLSETYRAFWVQQLVSLMDQAPQKWGHRLSPSLAQFKETSDARFGDRLSGVLWRAAIIDGAKEVAAASLFENSSMEDVSKEVVAFASLLKAARTGTFDYAGHVAADGTTKLHPQARLQPGLWTLDSATGQVSRLDATGKPMAYAPIFAFRAGTQTVTAAIREAADSSGLNLDQAKYRELIPLVFAQ